MAQRAFLILILFTGFSFSCFAQLYPTQYRPPNQDWQIMETAHFNLLYAKGDSSSALHMGQILESEYNSVQHLVGGSLNDFPVILNSYNDRSNGFVTSLHFRSEIELPPMKGKSLNPQTGGWLQNVGPHELVHALQFSNLGENNISRLFSLLSPDLARGFHGAIPSGMLEGIAVYHESNNVATNGGRGNFPMFNNRFNAIFNSDKRWSMGQMMHISSDTRPLNRHYIGGYKFSEWIQQEYGSSTTRQALDFYMDYPFLGYGVALRHVTGNWPNQLYDQFQKDKEDSQSSKTITYQNLPIPYKGREIRRPKWLSDSKLIFYGSFYNARPGFYSFDLETEKLNHILTTGSVGDYQYDLSADYSEMVFSYFNADPIYNNTSIAEVVRYNLNTGNKEQLTHKGRVYAPVYFENALLALQTLPASSKLISLDPNADSLAFENMIALKDTEITAVDVQSASNNLAIVANKSGNQSLWLSGKDELSSEIRQAPDLAFNNGSIFDPEWHPRENKLLFSSDFSGTHQLYELNLQDSSITQVTNAPYNAFEGSYSPDGNRIAYIKQVENERLPVVINRSEFSKVPVSPDQLRFANSNKKPPSVISDSVISASANWQTSSYSGGTSWLKPRTVFPVMDEVANREVFQAGVGLYSNNLLQNQSYSAEITYLQDRLWYDLTYQNKTFYPGFKAQLSSAPSYLSFTTEQMGQTVGHTLLRQNRSISLSIPLEVRLNQNIYSTSFFVEPEIRQSQMRLFEIGNASGRSEFINNTATNIYSQFNYRLQQNIRDIQPNAGALFYAEVEHMLDAEDLPFNAYNNNITLSLQKSTALQAGIYKYLSPLRQWNQSLRVSLQGITQSGLIFDNQSMVSNGFSEPVLPGSQNLMSLDTRYTIPLAFVDDGGFLLPLYLSNIYLVAFSNSVTNPTFQNWYEQSRSVFGIGLRTRFRVSNLSLDIGVGVGYEPTRGDHQLFIGDF